MASLGLLVMLALTYSRAGFVVLAFEAVAWVAFTRRFDKVRVFSAVVALAVLAARLSPRINLDGAVLNRPKIWLAGLKLAAANPFGVGLGNSGAVATAFLLPEGVEVRTLVNSHLTLVAEAGWLVGGLWLAFVFAALLGGVRRPRLWIVFAGLVLSASFSSVFDWHVLFGAGDCGGTWLNAALSWSVFSAFVVAGVALAAHCRSVPRLAAAFACPVALAAAAALVPTSDAPKVADGFVVQGRPSGIAAFYDSTWTLKTLRESLPEGSRIALESGVPKDAATAADDEIWLFGYAAESARRFEGRKVSLVSPPDYLEGT